MKKTITIIILLLYCAVLSYSQKTITIQPDSIAGKDALLHGLTSEKDKNSGNSAQLPVCAWTFDGEEGIVRSVFEFDLKSIPKKANVIRAQLTLYAWDKAKGGDLGQHQALSGPNDCWIEKVTSPWDEKTVTWNTQPETTIQGRVGFSLLTKEANQNVCVDVTELVQDMINNPTTNFGFMLKLQNESYYRRVNFCSSDHENPALHPKLEIYTTKKNTKQIMVND
jgi:hypothetical protein